MTNASGPFLAEKTAISNIVRFTATFIYKYKFNYKFDGINEEAKRAVLAETLGFTHTPFFINGVYVYCASALQSNPINTFWEGIPIKIFFFLQEKINLAEDRQLLQLLIERFIKFEPIEFSDKRIVFNLNVVNNICNKENLLHIDFLFYVVKKESWADKTWRPNNSRETRVYFKQQIYSVCLFSKADNCLCLKSNSGQIVLAPPNLCFQVESLEKILLGPSKVMILITELFASKELKIWNLKFNGSFRVKVRILPLEKIKFGDGVECVPINGSWITAVRENEFFNPVELWSWCVLYTKADFLNAHLLVTKIRELPEETGILVGEPLYIQINDDIHDYNKTINSIVSKNLQFIIVFVPNTKNKPDSLIRYLCCIQNSIPFLIIRRADLIRSSYVYDVLLKINTILGGNAWTVDIAQFKDIMFCGSDYYSPKDITKPKVCSLIANLSDDGFSWCSCSEIINDDNLSFLVASVHDSMKKYCDINGRLPKRIVIYQRVEDHNHEVLRTFYNQHFDINFCKNIEVIVLFVRTNSQTLFFRTSNGVALNLPPGTVINDPLLTDNKNFYLVSKYSSSTEVVRPTHYNIVHDKCQLGLTDLMIMTYKMCHLNCSLPKICEIPAPLSYARKLCVLISDFGVTPKSSDLNGFLYFL